jgi:hypothetical protein
MLRSLYALFLLLRREKKRHMSRAAAAVSVSAHHSYPRLPAQLHLAPEARIRSAGHLAVSVSRVRCAAVHRLRRSAQPIACPAPAGLHQRDKARLRPNSSSTLRWRRLRRQAHWCGPSIPAHPEHQQSPSRVPAGGIVRGDDSIVTPRRSAGFLVRNPPGPDFRDTQFVNPDPPNATPCTTNGANRPREARGGRAANSPACRAK